MAPLSTPMFATAVFAKIAVPSTKAYKLYRSIITPLTAAFLAFDEKIESFFNLL